VVVCVFSIHVIISFVWMLKANLQIIVSFFGYQFNSFKFLVGLTVFDFSRFF